MATDERERQALQRAAFGRPGSAAEEETATAALHVLYREQRAAVEAEPEPEPPAEVVGPDDIEAPAPRRPRVRLVLALVACLAIGAAVPLLIGGNRPTAVEPTPSPVALPGGVIGAPTLGNLKAADAWFARPQAGQDVFTDPPALVSLGIDPDSTRLVETSATGVALWVGRSGQSLCLLWSDDTADSGQTAGSACATREDFTTRGVGLSFNTDSFQWNGATVTATVGSH